MNHPSVVQLYDYTETPDQYVMFMEYCDKGPFLYDKIQEVSKNSHHLKLLQ